MSDHERILRKRLWISVGLTMVIFLAELLGGLWTHSLALLSDSFHVLTDTLSLALTLVAIYFAMRPPSDRYTFGFHRLEIFAASFNAGSLLVICFWLAWEAIERLLNPQPILAKEMLLIAFVGLIANAVVIAILHSHMGQSLNVKSAVLHVIGDTVSSIVVVVGGATVAVTGWFWIDPVLSLVIIAIIVYHAFKVAMEAAHVLMEGVPYRIDIHSVRKTLESIQGVRQVHDLHVWSLCSSCRYLSAHMVIDEKVMMEPSSVINSAQEMLRNRFNIHHATLQLETSMCSNHYLCDNHNHPDTLQPSRHSDRELS